MKNLALFDFDGTITNRDTMVALVRFLHSPVRYYGEMARLSPILLGYKLNIIQNDVAKKHFLARFIGGVNAKEFDERCKQFAQEVIPLMVRNRALEEINALQNSGYRIVIVSASAENWVKPWADIYGYEVIATQLQIRDQRINGKLEGKNCHGREKVNRIRQTIDLQNYEVIHAYGDSRGDLPMLALASEGRAFYKPFR